MDLVLPVIDDYPDQCLSIFFREAISGGVCDGFMSLTVTSAVGCVQTLGAGSWLAHVPSGQWVSLRPSGSCVLTFGLASPPLSDFWDFWLVIFRYQHLQSS